LFQKVVFRICSKEMKSFFTVLLILCIFVKLLQSEVVQDMGESPPEEPVDDISPVEYLYDAKEDSNTTTASENSSNSTEPLVPQDPSVLPDFTLWNLTNSKWSFSGSSLDYDASANETSIYAISPIVLFSSGVLYEFSFTATGEQGSAVIEISFANISNFNPIANETFLISGPGNGTKRDSSQISQYSFIASFPESEIASLIFKVCANSHDALFTISNFQLVTTLISTAAPTCSSYLGFQVYEIEKLLTSLSSQQLRLAVASTTRKLQKLKDKIIHQKELAYDLPLGNWIDLFNSFKDGNACEFNFQDFDTWTWLFNYQIASTIQSVDTQPLVRKRK